MPRSKAHVPLIGKVRSECSTEKRLIVGGSADRRQATACKRRVDLALVNRQVDGGSARCSITMASYPRGRARWPAYTAAGECKAVDDQS
jgi:hypothetical protein